LHDSIALTSLLKLCHIHSQLATNTKKIISSGESTAVNAESMTQRSVQNILSKNIENTTLKDNVNSSLNRERKSARTAEVQRSINAFGTELGIRLRM
jgi:hypothetical protein